MEVVAQTRERDRTALEWDIMFSVFTDGTSRLASIAAGSFTLPPHANNRDSRHPITGLVVRLDGVKEPASARIHGVPNADNGVIGDFPEPYAEHIFDALDAGTPFILDLTYDSGEHETVHVRTLGGFGGSLGVLGMGHGVDAPVRRCLRSLVPASQSGLRNRVAEFSHPA